MSARSAVHFLRYSSNSLTMWSATSPPGDALGAMVVLLFSVVAAWPLISGGVVVGQDAAVYFYPIYSFLGDRLRSGDIPGWNPYQFAGIPSAANPESGWMYLPAMLFFALLPLTAAAKAFVFFHLAMAGLSTYVFARMLGMTVVGGLVAAAGYELTGWFYRRSVCCPAYVQVAAWLPLALIGVELCIRGRSFLAWVGGIAVAGLAVSQILAAWLGQGAYYALLVVGSYMAYRTLIDPPEPTRSLWLRFCNLATLGAAVLAVGFGLAAAGILPRLEYHDISILADGYRGDPGRASRVGGWFPTVTGVVNPLVALGSPSTTYHAGGAILALAMMGAFIARAGFRSPYFAALLVGALVLTTQGSTVVHNLLYVLPRFEELHQHWPERVTLVVYLGSAMLAGAAISSLKRWGRMTELLTFVAIVPLIVALQLGTRGLTMARPSLHAAIMACLGVAAFALLPIPSARRLVPVLLFAVVTWEMLTIDDQVLDGALHGAVDRYGALFELDLAEYYEPMGTGEFLRSRNDEQPFRYFGYDPQVQKADFGTRELYRYQFGDLRVAALLVNNRSTFLQLPDLQGMDPVQLQRYADYMTALNGHAQEYHGAYVFEEGLESPLLDLLNARYIVIPAQVSANRTDLLRLLRTYPAVYEDEQVMVLENPDALQRAWIVHDARQVDRGEALPLLVSGDVDPRETALLEEPPPPLSEPSDPSADEVAWIEQDPDRVVLRTTTDAPGLLVLSEVYYPAWKAYVDGERVELYLANHTFRAVPIPAGEHTVELRFESRTLQVGTAISSVTFVGVIAAWALAAWRRRRGMMPPATADGGQGSAG